jgi:hypothetical protein
MMLHGDELYHVKKDRYVNGHISCKHLLFQELHPTGQWLINGCLTPHTKKCIECDITICDLHNYDINGCLCYNCVQNELNKLLNEIDNKDNEIMQQIINLKEKMFDRRSLIQPYVYNNKFFDQKTFKTLVYNKLDNLKELEEAMRIKPIYL